jgi:hypothetical protein
LAEDPNEPFLHYAICLEIMKKDGDAALPLFRELLLAHPSYLPAYFQTARLMAENGLTNEAVEVLDLGLPVAESQADFHALSEMKGLKQDILAGEFD